MRHRWLLNVVLTLACIASAVAVIFTSYDTRKQYAQLQTLRDQSQTLSSRYGQLLLEQTALQNLGRVERIAVQQWQMRLPEGQSLTIWRE